MSGLLSQLPPNRRRELLEDLSYLNLAEIRTFCHAHRIPYRIEVETPDGRVRPTSDTDRKPIVLHRVRHYLTTGEVLPPTRLPAGIVRDDPPPPKLGPTDRIYYRWYNKTYDSVLRTLADLTGGRFKNGALARVLIMEFWSRGEAPTFQEFADAWLSARDQRRDLLTPEYAFLTDLRHGEAGPDWKSVRNRKAAAALATLDKLTPSTEPRTHPH